MQLTSATAITATGAQAGTAIDISAATLALTEPTLSLTIVALSATSGTPSVRISVEDSVNAYTNSAPVAVAHLTGPILAPVTLSWTWDQISTLRYGVAGATVRANVTLLTGTGASVSINLEVGP